MPGGESAAVLKEVRIRTARVSSIATRQVLQVWVAAGETASIGAKCLLMFPLMGLHVVTFDTVIAA